MPSVRQSELKAYRIAKKVALIEIAAATGLPSSYLGDIEAEKIAVLDSDLDRIAKAIRKIAADTTRFDK